MKRGIIFDDQALFAEAFSMLLDKIKFFDVITVFSDPEKLKAFFMDEYSQLRMDELFLFADYLVPGYNINSLIADIRKFYPNIKVILVTAVIGKILIQQAMDIKPEAFISKSLGVSEIMEAIHVISSGDRYISPNISEILEQTKQNDITFIFTRRELDVLNMIAKGYSIKEIADRMMLSIHTVVSHRRNMMSKANCSSITSLLSFALNNGLIHINQ